MTPNPGITNREFAMLSARVDEAVRRLDSIDEHGTRGVTVIQTQLSELTRQVGKLEGRMDAHSHVHEQDARDRRSGRRWLVSTGVAGVAAMGVVIGLLLQLAGHVH